MEYEGRKVIAKILVGSHNYNLNDETSDKDGKMVVLPTFDDLYTGKKFSKSVKIDGDDYDIKDVRLILEQLEKSNIAYLEILKSKEVYIYDENFQKIGNRGQNDQHRIANNDIYRMFKSIKGQMKEKEMAIVKDLPNQESNEGYLRKLKFGFDTKQLMHGMRLNGLVILFESRSKFKTCKSILNFLEFDSMRRLLLLSVKTNVNNCGTKDKALHWYKNTFEYGNKSGMEIKLPKDEGLKSDHGAVKFQNKDDVFVKLKLELQEFIKESFANRRGDN